MSCYSCAASFGLFKKEQGCKNCGYSFCKDCLTKKATIPKLNEKHKVCVKCYRILTGQTSGETSKGQYSPPEAYKKRIAKLENKSSSHPASSRTQNIPPAGSTQTNLLPQYRGMAREDQAIAARLQKLKEDKKDKKNIPSQKEMEERLEKLKTNPDAAPTATEQEMAARLAKMKGQDPEKTTKPHVFASDRRPQAQQVDDLLQEICDEVEIDSHGLDHAADVQNRLDQYHGQNGGRPDDLENNLNTPNSKDQFTYTKTIPQVDSKFESVSGEDVGWSEMNQLIHQVAGEMELDANKAIVGLQKDKELWDRVSKLKARKKKKSVGGDEDVETNSKKSNKDSQREDAMRISVGHEEESDEENEEEACKSIIKQLLEESRLEDQLEEEETIGRKMRKVPDVTGDTATKSKSKRMSRGSSSEPEFEADPDELSWCCICNNDASMRCMGCDGDLYCKRCYREGHDREDYRDHQTRPYKPSAKHKH